MFAVWVVLLAIALVVYHRLSARRQVYWLLLLSYAFYAWWAWRFLPVLVLLTLTSHATAARIAAIRPSRDERDRWRRRLLAAGILRRRRDRARATQRRADGQILRR